jgi:lincosamide nucleotidyltransferase A/C/D/E
MAVRASEAAEVLKALDDAGVDAWVDGGWGVDALIGRETRPHEDLDLMVSASDAAPVAALLEAHRFRLVAGTSTAGVYRDDAGRSVDVRAIVFDGTGRGVFRTTSGGETVYPAKAFKGRGSIGGVVVPCLTATAQMLSHTGYEPTEKDAHDVRLLHESFDLPVPPVYC